MTLDSRRVPLILVVDDQRALRDTLAYTLRRAGYEVRTAADGATAVSAAQAEPPDLILLDVMLPGGIDGFEVCRSLRGTLRCPIILVSALADEVDRVVGLEVGADDYVTKPFSLSELLARVKAKLRRIEMQAAANEPVAETGRALMAPGPRAPLRVGDLVIDPVQREARRNGRAIHLKRREFDLLYYLARHAGTVVPRSRLLDAVWPEDLPAGSDSRTVDVHVHRLRDRIEPHPSKPRYLHTVRGLGYVLRAPDRFGTSVPAGAA